MALIREAYFRLFDNTTEFPWTEELIYSGQFRAYNANVSLRGDKLVFKLSKKWKSVSPDIQVGLIQELFLKILKKKGISRPTTTVYIELYHHFLRKVHTTITKEENDPILSAQFDVLNEHYFINRLEKPNLRWGDFSLSTLGHYHFGSDSITISKALHPACDAPLEVLQYVIYHEMLHKKHQFKGSHGRTYSHTPAFRDDEKKFDGWADVEKQMKTFLGRQKSRQKLFSFF